MRLGFDKGGRRSSCNIHISQWLGHSEKSFEVITHLGNHTTATQMH